MAGRMWRALRRWIDHRPAAVPLLVLGALLIAVAAGPTPTESSWTGIPDTSVIRWILVGIVLALCGLGLLVLVATRTVPARGESRRRSWVAMFAALLLIGLFSLIDFEAELPPPEEAEQPPLVDTQPLPPNIDPGPGFAAGDLIALVAIVVVALILLVWTRRRSTETPIEEDEPEASPIGAALGRAHELLLDGDDPRQAVLLAYRDLERTLESLDLPRDPAETPTEHLHRALGALSITDPTQAEPLLDLSGLYARARYSDHPISADEQRRAAASLGRARRRVVGAD